jgi:hypothetical protein
MRYEGAGGRSRWRRWVPVAVGAAAAVMACVVAFGPTDDPGPVADQVGPPPTDGSGSTAVATGPSPGPSTDPVTTAENWLTAYRTIGYRDPGPTSWAGRVTPLLAEPMRSQIADQAASGSGGVSWERFTTRRCSTHVSDVGAVVPAEAPRTPTTVYVQVTGTVITSCDVAGVAQPDEPFSATLELHKASGQDRWQVARRLF